MFILSWDGQPIRGALVVYGFVERDFNVIQAKETAYPGSITETDAQGRVLIITKGWDDLLKPLLHRHTRRELIICLAYAPKLHNSDSPNLQGDFETVRVHGNSIYMKDLSDNPFRWARSLDNTYALIAQQIIHPTQAGQGIYPAGSAVRAPKQMQVALISAYVQDAKAFMTRYGALTEPSNVWSIKILAASLAELTANAGSTR
jgi:hypothetical protein